MSDQELEPLDREDLDQLAGEPLPERAAMSLVNANVAAPVNLAAALNVASDHATAFANATQTAPITQSNGGGAASPLPAGQVPPTGSA